MARIHSIARAPHPAPVPSRYIRELKDPFAPRIGFVVGGAQPGPVLVVSGATGQAAAVFQRLMLLPSLARIRGRLFLVHLEAAETATGAATLRDMLPPADLIDRHLSLPFLRDGGEQTDDGVTRAYWQVLDLAARMGMISGRGVPERRMLQ
ncbi:MAG: hypothetical protein ACU0CO_07070 [Shimia sp.]